jgi:hypothetical protein
MTSQQRIEEAKAVIEECKRSARNCDVMSKQAINDLIASYEAMGVEMERTMKGRMIMAADNERLALESGKPAGYYRATEIDNQWDNMVKEWKIKADIEVDKVKNIKRYNDELFTKLNSYSNQFITDDMLDTPPAKKKDLCVIM